MKDFAMHLSGRTFDKKTISAYLVIRAESKELALECGKEILTETLHVGSVKEVTSFTFQS